MNQLDSCANSWTHEEHVLCSTKSAHFWCLRGVFRHETCQHSYSPVVCWLGDRPGPERRQRSSYNYGASWLDLSLPAEASSSPPNLVRGSFNRKGRDERHPERFVLGPFPGYVFSMVFQFLSSLGGHPWEGVFHTAKLVANLQETWGTTLTSLEPLGYVPTGCVDPPAPSPGLAWTCSPLLQRRALRMPRLESLRPEPTGSRARRGGGGLCS